jgi:hypothetical protein
VNIVDAWLCALANPAATLTPLGRQAIMVPRHFGPPAEAGW